MRPSRAATAATTRGSNCEPLWVRIFKPRAVRLLELLVELGELVPQLSGRADGTQGIVLVHRGHAETAMTASPMNFSTEPPWRSRIVCAVSK